MKNIAVAEEKKSYELPQEKWEDLLCGDYVLTAEPTIKRAFPLVSRLWVLHRAAWRKS